MEEKSVEMTRQALSILADKINAFDVIACKKMASLKAKETVNKFAGRNLYANSTIRIGMRGVAR
jgi:hypothetical protein